MPVKKPIREQERQQPPDAPVQQPQHAQEHLVGRSGQGADSALVQLKEQEKTEGRKTGRG
jgi:hypothetical protein